MLPLPKSTLGCHCRLVRQCLLAGALLAGTALIPTASAERPEDAEPEVTAEELALIKQAEAARVQAIEKVYPAVVAIYGNNRKGGGSGVLFDPAGFALTNHHVVAAAGTEGKAGLADGKFYPWKLIGTDPGGDLAIIQLEHAEDLPYVRLGDSDRVRVGDFVMAMGNPFLLAEDQKPTVTLGIVSGTHRFQPGTGVNQLIYGNCIQVDSSINPGNSGGPLFNLQSEVIGINGRGSFEERGRVNVGVGYAISLKQIRNFLPDLLATKIAQHGSLEAVFVTLDGKVVLDRIGKQSVAARAGMRRGDELVSFEGEPIEDANEFTNLISTLPANWPVKIVYRRGGQEQRVQLRLAPLPYQADPKAVPRQGPAPGEIRDRAVNQKNLRMLLRRTRDDLGILDGMDAAAVELADNLIRRGKTVGGQKLLIARDGRFRLEYKLDDKHVVFGFDGSHFWRQGEKTETLPAGKLTGDPLFAQAASLAGLLHLEAFNIVGSQTLDGGDKALGRHAYRIKVDAGDNREMHVWLSVFDQKGQPHVRPLKAGRLDGEAVDFAGWQELAGITLPLDRRVIAGLAETEQLRIVNKDHEVHDEISDGHFQKPANDE